MPTHILIRGWQRSGENLQFSQQIDEDGEVNSDLDSIASGTEPQAVIAIDVSQLKSLFLYSDQDVTLRTNANSGGAPDATIALKAGVPLIWESANGYFSNPLGSTDVTSIFVDNDSGSAANVKIRVLQDVTP